MHRAVPKNIREKSNKNPTIFYKYHVAILFSLPCNLSHDLGAAFVMAKKAKMMKTVS